MSGTPQTFDRRACAAFRPSLGLEDGVVPGNARALLVVLCLGVAHAVELRRRTEHAATEPDGEALHLVRNDIHVKLCGRDAGITRGRLLRGVELLALVNPLLDVPLEPSPKVLEHRGTAREHDVPEQAAARVNRALEDGLVDNLRQRDGEVGGENLGVEKDLRTEEF